MNKHILLLLIMNSSFTYAMKNHSYFSSDHNQIPNESKLILNIRASKNEFENQLLDNTWENGEIGYNSNMKLSRFWLDDFKPINFFRSCYYKFHQKMTITKLKLSSSLLNRYQNTQIDGYSALSAAILSNDISHDVKHNFIQELINLNFKPTVKDIELAELYLYDSHEITKYKKIFLHLLQNNPNSNWFIMPYDIRKQIVYYLLLLFKKETWLLPEKSKQKEENITYYMRGGIIEIIQII